MADRNFDLPGVWAQDAVTVIPGAPAQNTPYRNTALAQATVKQGWPFAKIVNSADFNQFLYVSSLMLQQLSAQGVLSWNPAVAYPVGALALGSDMQLYRCIQASTNNNPTASPLYWTLAFASTISFASNAETQAGAIDNKAVQPAGLLSCFAQSRGTSGWKKLAGGEILQWIAAAPANVDRVTLAWPIPFPSAVETVQVATVVGAGHDSCSHNFQIMSQSRTSVVCERGSGCDNVTGPAIFGIGY